MPLIVVSLMIAAIAFTTWYSKIISTLLLVLVGYALGHYTSLYSLFAMTVLAVTAIPYLLNKYGKEYDAEMAGTKKPVSTLPVPPEPGFEPTMKCLFLYGLAYVGFVTLSAAWVVLYLKTGQTFLGDFYNSLF